MTVGRDRLCLSHLPPPILHVDRHGHPNLCRCQLCQHWEESIHIAIGPERCSMSVLTIVKKTRSESAFLRSISMSIFMRVITISKGCPPYSCATRYGSSDRIQVVTHDHMRTSVVLLVGSDCILHEICSQTTRRFTEASSWYLNIVSLSPEHRHTQTDRATKPIIHRSYQGDTRQ